jgi:hypothetical protein
MPYSKFIWPIYYYKIRWKIVSCFHTRVYPTSITIGEVFFFLMIVVACIIGGSLATGMHPSGELADIPLIGCFMLATRNSIVT